MSSLASRRAWMWMLAVMPLFAGCTTHAQRVRDARRLFHQGDLGNSALSLNEAQSRWHRDNDCLQLDRAMIALVDGRPTESEKTLREVRDRFDYLEQASLGESALSLFSDDKQRAYAGEDYERVLICAFLSLANLMHDGGDAGAYALQVEQKQKEIIERGMLGAKENPKLAYKQVALAPYVHGVLREASHNHYDEAAKSFAKVVSWEPSFAGGPQDLQRVQQGVHSPPGHGVAYVFTFVGQGPYKEECAEQPTSDALLIADQILSAIGKYQLPPTIAPIKVPHVVIPRNEVDGVQVVVNQRHAGFTQTITDVGQLAVSQHQAVHQHLVARAVVRRVVKKAVAYGVQDGLDVKNQWTSLGILAAGVAWEFTESADTRCWGLLPNLIQVQRLELPVGTHRLDLRPARRGAPFGSTQTCELPITDGRNTYVLACFPTRQLVGRIQVSDPLR